MNKSNVLFKYRASLLLGVLIAPLLIGCSVQAQADTTAGEIAYTDTLDASYEDALDVTGQLVLGTLQLEGTAHAVTEAQAATLLPLWQALQGGELQGDAEQDAVLRQIESTMTEAQVSAIAGLRLTTQEAQDWTDTRGMVPSGGGLSQVLAHAVIELLIVRSGVADEGTTRPVVAQVAEQATEREPTSASEASESSAAAGASESPATTESRVAAESSTETESSGVMEDPTATASPSVEQDSAQETESSTPESAESVVYVVQAGDSLSSVENSGQTAAALLPALEQREDTDPGPPFTIEVSLNRAVQDPLVEKSQTYLVTGVVRNDGDRTYAVSGIEVTFYDAEGFRGTFDPAIRDGKVVGGEWNWHGRIEADFAALLLAPGEKWPFRIEITAQDMASFLIHPDAVATERQSAPLELSGVTVVDEGTGYVRISGVATNANAFKVKNVTVSGALLDANGQIVSLGSTYVLQEDIEPGESVRFDARVEKEPYVRYQLYGQAERDWD